MDGTEAKDPSACGGGVKLLHVFGIVELAENVLWHLRLEDLFRAQLSCRTIGQQVTGYIDSFRATSQPQNDDVRIYRRRCKKQKKVDRLQEAQAAKSSTTDSRFMNPYICRALVYAQKDCLPSFVIGTIAQQYALDRMPWPDMMLSRPNTTKVILLEASAFLRETVDEDSDVDAVEFYRPRPSQLTADFYQKYCNREPLVIHCPSGLTLGAVLKQLHDRSSMQYKRPFALVFDAIYLHEAARALGKAASQWVDAEYQQNVPYGRSWWHTLNSESWEDGHDVWSTKLDDNVWPVVEETWSSGSSESEYAWSTESDE